MGYVRFEAQGVCVIVSFVGLLRTNADPPENQYYRNVEKIKLICILVSINNCPIYNQPEFCHHEASGLATISVFPLGLRNVGAFPPPSFTLNYLPL